MSWMLLIFNLHEQKHEQSSKWTKYFFGVLLKACPLEIYLSLSLNMTCLYWVGQKTGSGFALRWYRKTQTNSLAYPIFRINQWFPIIPQKKRKKKKERKKLTQKPDFMPWSRRCWFIQPISWPYLPSCTPLLITFSQNNFSVYKLPVLELLYLLFIVPRKLSFLLLNTGSFSSSGLLKIKASRFSFEKFRFISLRWSTEMYILIKTWGDLPSNPEVKNLPSNVGDKALIHGWRTKIPQAAGHLSPCVPTTNSADPNYWACMPNQGEVGAQQWKIPHAAIMTQYNQINNFFLKEPEAMQMHMVYPYTLNNPNFKF